MSTKLGVHQYSLVERVIEYYKETNKGNGTIMGQKIRDMNTVNGTRITLEDGTWGLVRAISNTPNLMFLVERSTSQEDKIGIFRAIESQLVKYDEIGEYDQKTQTAFRPGLQELLT